MQQAFIHTQHEQFIRLANLSHDDHLLAPFHLQEVKQLLHRSPRRAPGPSGLTYHVLRNLPDSVIQAITDLYNASLACGYFPIPFKTANVRLIPKPQKDLTDPSNYRPISLLDGLGKTFERLLMNRLRIHLDTNDLLPPTQFGFRPHSSTEDAINSILTYVDSAYSSQQKTLIVTRDVQKAFDTVWHTGLKHKLISNFDLPPLFSKLLCNFLTDRRCRILHKHSASHFFSPRAGVPQGSVLAPTLYNMYTHDIPNVTHPDSLLIQYADDVTILARSKLLDTLTARMQGELNSLTLWERKWLIHTHPEKATATYFSIKRATPPPLFQSTTIALPTPIPVTHTAKILGVSIDNKFKFHYHTKTQTHIARKALSNLFRFRSAAVKTKKHLYNALILPLLTYCPLALKHTARTNTLSLQRIQNKAFRWIHSTKWHDFTTNETLHHTTKRPPLNILWHHRTLKQIHKFSLSRPLLYQKLKRLSHHRTNPNSLTLLDPNSHPLPDPILT